MEYVEVARAESERGELVLRERREHGARRAGAAGQRGLRDGHPETSTERALAAAALELRRRPAGRAGRRARARLHDARGARRPAASSGARVVEIEQALVDWMRDGTIPHGPGAARRRAGQRRGRRHRGRGRRGGRGDLRPGAARRRQRPGLPRARDQRRALPAGRSSRRTPTAAPGRRAGRSGRPPRARLEATLERGLRQRRGAVRTTCVCRSATSSTGSTSARVPSDPMSDETTSASSTTPWARSGCPRDALWRAQTQRAVENFPISGTPLEPAHVHALARVKAAAAEVNAELGVLDRRAGRRDRRRGAARSSRASTTTHFPIDVFQTGSGTSSNMNVNEVIATLATRAGAEVHPNDHVNASQSSNDTFPTVDPRRRRARRRPTTCCPRSTPSRAALEARPTSSPALVKSGRTHLMDATPVMLGQEFGGYAATVRLRRRAARVGPPPGPRAAARRHRRRHRHQHAAGLRRAGDRGARRGRPASRSPRPATTSRRRARRDALVELCGLLRTIAVGLTKICNDLRWMAVGPDHRPGRDPPARPAAGLEHHARQGQPGAARRPR